LKYKDGIVWENLQSVTLYVRMDLSEGPKSVMMIIQTAGTDVQTLALLRMAGSVIQTNQLFAFQIVQTGSFEEQKHVMTMILMILMDVLLVKKFRDGVVQENLLFVTRFAETD